MYLFQNRHQLFGTSPSRSLQRKKEDTRSMARSSGAGTHVIPRTLLRNRSTQNECNLSHVT